MSTKHSHGLDSKRINWKARGNEVQKSVIAQPVTSIVLLLVVALVSCTVILTAGRGEGAQAQILAQIESAEIRSVTLHDNSGALELDTTWIAELEQYDIIEAVTGIGRTADVTISANEAATKVSASDIYATWLDQLETPFQGPGSSTSALATQGALTALGFHRGVGVARIVPDGEDVVVLGQINLPSSLAHLQDSVIIPHSAEEVAPLQSVVVTAKHVEDVPLTLKVISTYLTGFAPEDYNLESSANLVKVRGAVKGELTKNNYISVLFSLATAVAVSMTVVWAVVLLKRRDFGRRRALGASKKLIVSLVMGQTLLIATFASIFGTSIGLVWLTATGAPTPTVRFSSALIIAMTVLSTLSSAPPALWAGNRDPLTELRVP